MRAACCSRFAGVLAGLVIQAGVGARAADLGSVGPVHGIREPHAIEYIQARLRAMERNGELAEWERESKERIVSGIRRPKPIEGLTATTTARTFYYDPTLTVAENIVDHLGNILIPAGTRQNPLDVLSLSKHLLFFDARDARQVAFAKRLIAHYGGRVKPILVGGSYLELMKEWRQPVYYDQWAYLVKRFGITQVPAIVSQEGRLLRVDEVKVKG